MGAYYPAACQSESYSGGLHHFIKGKRSSEPGLVGLNLEIFHLYLYQTSNERTDALEVTCIDR